MLHDPFKKGATAPYPTVAPIMRRSVVLYLKFNRMFHILFDVQVMKQDEDFMLSDALNNNDLLLTKSSLVAGVIVYFDSYFARTLSLSGFRKVSSSRLPPKPCTMNTSQVSFFPLPFSILSKHREFCCSPA